jgi:Na+-driven multidrug efflux pump
VFRGLGDTKAPLYATLGVSAANIALCPALIFGAGWGVPGAALATVFAEVP